MCGRFDLDAAGQLIQQRFGIQEKLFDVAPRYNIAPTQLVRVVHEDGGTRVLDTHRWGLVPSWAKDPAIGSRMINARAETVAEKPSFKASLKRRRCLIPATGFYEWKLEGKVKTPTHITLPHRELFGFAGLWDEWLSPDGSPLRTCTIITIAPNPFMASIHNRMPVIMAPEHEAEWLNLKHDTVPDLLELLQPYAGAMDATPVSTRVNNATYDAPDCIEALTE